MVAIVTFIFTVTTIVSIVVVLILISIIQNFRPLCGKLHYTTCCTL